MTETNVTIFPFANRSGLISKIADRLDQFDRESAPGAADVWWRSLVDNYRKKAGSWGIDQVEIDRELRKLHHAVTQERFRRYAQRKHQRDERR